MNAKEMIRYAVAKVVANRSPDIIEKRPGPLYSLHVFADAATARMYRHAYGTGGWIFAIDGGGMAMLFPPHMTPTTIIHHPMVKGKSGDLIGCA
jgi:oxalate decarboxylase/phosphoglucose isomerase-like protein (cupin superfamily)